MFVKAKTFLQTHAINVSDEPFHTKSENFNIVIVKNRWISRIEMTSRWDLTWDVMLKL